MTLLWLLIGAGIAGGIGWWIWRETTRAVLLEPTRVEQLRALGLPQAQIVNLHRESGERTQGTA